MKVFSKFKVLGVALATLAAVGITACGGGGNDAASASDEGDELYLAWFNKLPPYHKFILEKVERFEGVADNTELGNALKVSRISRTYKDKNEYRPEQEWKRHTYSEYFITAYTPDDIEKMRVNFKVEYRDEWYCRYLSTFGNASYNYDNYGGASISIPTKGTARVLYSDGIVGIANYEECRNSHLEITETSIGVKGKFTFKEVK